MSANPRSDDGITIAELAALTEVGEGTLRMWETRYGAPKPRRLSNGHRRYTHQDVELVSAAVEHRRTGLAVGAALARARAGITATPDSIFAALQEARPELAPRAMARPALERISHAIEDECLARAAPGLLIGSFEQARFYRPAQNRWDELAAGMDVTVVLADFRRRRISRRGPSEIPIPARSPLHREWAVIGPPGCLLARERPQSERSDPARVFDAIWSPEPEVAHQAARLALELVDDPALRRRAYGALGAEPKPSSPELRRAAALTNRIIGYLGTG